MKQMWLQLGLSQSSLAEVEAMLRDGGGEERQPAPRKFVVSGSSGGDIGAPQTLGVWRGQEPAQRIANTILLCAIRDHASQVLLEPGERGVSVRFIIESGVREQRLPSFALEPIVHHFRSLTGNACGKNNAEDDRAEPSRATKSQRIWPGSGLLRLSVDERLYDLRFSPILTRWGNGIRVQFSESS